MKLNKAVKKIIALGTGATMLGATLGASVFGAGLADYPAPFVKDGKFTGLLVVGDKAAAEDVIGVSDIAVSLQFAATKKVGKTTGESTVEGVSWKVGTSGKKLEIMENVDSGINGENIRNVSNTIDEDEFSLLADGEVTTEKGTAGYNQYINWDNAIISSTDGSGYVKLLENDDDVMADYFYVRSSERIGRYNLEFKKSMESDVEDSTGSKSTTGTFIGDLEDEKISILGKEYTIVKARKPSTTGNAAGVELTLMGGAQKDTLEEGETKTYSIKEKDYEVTVSAITDTGTITVKFIVNGESTRSLIDGETATLSDGVQIGVTDITPNEAGDVTNDQVEFFIGADKVFLKDTDVTDKASSNTMEVGNEDIDDVAVTITGTNDNSTFSIDNIQLNITADDDYYVAAGHKLSEYMDEPQAFLGSWDILYDGLETVETEVIKIKTSGSDQYDLVFVDGDGNSASVPLVGTDSSNSVHLGDSNDDLIVQGNQTITKNDYLIIVDTGQEDGQRKSYALRYKGASKVQSGETATVKFDNLGSGQRIEKTFTDADADTADAELKLGGATFEVINVSAATSNDFNIMVDLDADGTTTGDTDVVAPNSDAGLRIDILNSTNQTQRQGYVRVVFSTPDTNDYDNVKPTNISFNITSASGEVGFSESLGSAIAFVSPSSETNTNYGYVSTGAYLKWNNPSNDPDDLTIWYPKKQRLPQVFVVGTGATVSSKGGEAVESVTINRIDVGATKLASEVADVKTQNLILVGGPCANAAAAEAKGNPEDCAAGYEAGKGLIDLIDTGAGNFALIVAGYSAADTRTATAVLANYGDYSLKGSQMEVTTATSTVKEVMAK
ncbi:S-layer protein [Candidatus Woesearchaeota archaeon]|nr:S-layer protein [Candidatus Woesearchaeota archaeon]